MTPTPATPLQPFSLERMVRAVEKVRERLLRSTAALDKEAVAYAVIGGNAVAYWVTRVDEAAVRNTRDVDILIRRKDLEAAKAALEKAGFIYHETLDVHMFVDGPKAGARDAVHLLFAGEKVQPDDSTPAPQVSESEKGDHFQVVSLEALARMKLTSFRDKDRTHLRDMLELGLLDASWVSRFPPPLGARLQQLIDTPKG
jgi:hypothetical protein